MPDVSKDVLAIQVGTGKPEIHSGLTEEKMISLASRNAPNFGDRLRIITERLEAVKKEVVPNPDRVVEYFNVQMAQAQTDILVNRDLEQLGQSEQLAKMDALHRYTSVGSAILYDNVGYGGPSRFVGVTWPNLGWWPYNFNDRASSVRAWALNVVFENNWYGGRRLWLLGFPTIFIPDLNDVNFNNIASSYTAF